MKNIFKAELLVGRTDDGKYLAIHDKPKLKFCFLADSKENVLAKVDKALNLYVKHKIAPRAKLNATRFESGKAITSDQHSYTREIPYEAIA